MLQLFFGLIHQRISLESVSMLNDTLLQDVADQSSPTEALSNIFPTLVTMAA
jgi:hypothetical protein